MREQDRVKSVLRRSPPEALLRAATTETGHRQFDAPDFIERLSSFIQWINQRGPYSSAQIDAMRRQLQLVIATRMRIDADRQRFAAIADEKIVRPIFVVGFARSGTTLLHSLLAEDPDVLTPRAWHCLSPSPPPGEGPVCRRRFEYADRKINQLIDRVPGILTLDPYWDKYSLALIEDEAIFTLDLRNAYPTWFHQVSSLTVQVGVSGQDAAQTYKFHRQFLQHHQWNTGRERWASKVAGHQFLLDALLTCYPDAVCLWPHRDPIQVQASMFSIASVLYDAINPGGFDWPSFVHRAVEDVSAGLEQVMAGAAIDDPRIIHLRFDDIIRDPVGSIRGVYEKAALPYSPEFDRRMRAWLEEPENRSDRYGRYAHSYEPFNIQPVWVKRKFAACRERFYLH